MLRNSSWLTAAANTMRTEAVFTDAKSRIIDPGLYQRRDFPTEAVFTKAKSRNNDPTLLQRRQFCPGFLLVWIKWFRWRNLLSHWLLWKGRFMNPSTVSNFAAAANCQWIQEISGKQSRINVSRPFCLDQFLTLNTASGFLLILIKWSRITICSLIGCYLSSPQTIRWRDFSSRKLQIDGSPKSCKYLDLLKRIYYLTDKN
jgi:hypothetical protein